MVHDRIVNEYFEWLIDYVGESRYARGVSYTSLLARLHYIPFTYSIAKDQNRAEDGIDLRYRFALMEGYEDAIEEVLDILDAPCSVLEMMVALAIRCEETIMDDSCIGDRTAQWFWGMINNLGLGSMYNDNFDESYVVDVVACFLDREYEPDGRGGLFTIRDCDDDLRNVEIWYQLCWYLDSIT